MKNLIRLEKSKAFWVIIGLCVVFFLLRLPSLVEPYWYGDEGIYQVIGKAINDGRILYVDIWDNKPPLLYLTYALFHGDQYLVRLASAIVGLMTVVLYFLLSRQLFKPLYVSIVTTGLFVLLFGSPYLEGNIANAENFILLPIIAAAFVVYTLSDHKAPFLNNHKLLYIVTGFFMGIAFLFKIVALFDFAAFLLFLLFLTFPKKLSFSAVNKIVVDILPLILGFFIPLLLASIYFFFNNALSAFFESAFAGNVGYVGWKNTFIIPQGLLIAKSLFLAITVLLLFTYRKRLSRPMLFLFLWSAFEIYSTFFSQRPYTHYVLMLLPSVSLLVGMLFVTRAIPRTFLAMLLVAGSLTLMHNFYFYGVKKSFHYYENAFLFITGKKDVTAYQAFFDWKTPRDYTIVSYLKKNAKDTDTLFLWGDSAQIYALADKLPIGKYTVAYHMKQSKQTLDETERELRKANPTYIITLVESGALPFSLPNYKLKYAFEGATMYERTY